jgi:3-oxoadipate enol-lactonase
MTPPAAGPFEFHQHRVVTHWEASRFQYAFPELLGPGIRAIADDQRDTDDWTSPGSSYDLGDLPGDRAAVMREFGYDRAHIFRGSVVRGARRPAASDHPSGGRADACGSCVGPARHLHPGSATDDLVELRPDQRAAGMLEFVLSDRGRQSPELVAETRRFSSVVPPNRMQAG